MAGGTFRRSSGERGNRELVGHAQDEVSAPCDSNGDAEKRIVGTEESERGRPAGGQGKVTEQVMSDKVTLEIFTDYV